MRVVLSGTNDQHRPPHEVANGVVVAALEIPDRVTALLDGLSAVPGLISERASISNLESLSEIHDPAYLAFLKDTCTKLKGEPLFPSVFPYRAEFAINSGQAGTYCFDTHTPLLSGTFDAACRMASAAIQAADAVAQGESVAYALGRPPGHHAERAKYGGYSYLNSTALAANAPRPTARISGDNDIESGHELSAGEGRMSDAELQVLQQAGLR